MGCAVWSLTDQLGTSLVIRILKWSSVSEHSEDWLCAQHYLYQPPWELLTGPSGNLDQDSPAWVCWP
jgi:hypothetical protein